MKKGDYCESESYGQEYLVQQEFLKFKMALDNSTDVDSVMAINSGVCQAILRATLMGIDKQDISDMLEYARNSDEIFLE